MESIFRNTEYDTAGLAKQLNSASHADVQRVLELCLDVPRWIEAIVDQRPFDNDEAASRAVFSAAAPLTDEEIHRALQVHPRIGERPSGGDTHAEQARGEQSGVDVTRADVSRRLREGNLAYEQRFGHVFLIRAAGRDSSDILAALGERLGNDPESELRIIEHELREIAALRLGVSNV